jgi:hypothetical protein
VNVDSFRTTLRSPFPTVILEISASRLHVASAAELDELSKYQMNGILNLFIWIHFDSVVGAAHMPHSDGSMEIVKLSYG